MSNRKNPGVVRVARGAVIAAAYAVTCYALHPISYGVIQLRISEALAPLPILYAEAVPGLFVGCLAANLVGGLGAWDVFGGSLVTLLAAYLTRLHRRSILAYVWPVVLNAFLISIYLSRIFGYPYWASVLSIGASEAIVVFGLGLPLVRFLSRAGVGRKESGPP